MKKILFIALFFGIVTGYAQKLLVPQPVIPGLKTVIKMGGSFNGTTKLNGSATASTVADIPNAIDKIWYTKKDTINNTGTKTYKQEIQDDASWVDTWVVLDTISGLNSACVLTLYGVGKNSDVTSAVAIYTVSPSGVPKTYGYQFNGWGWNAFWWTLTGAGTHSTTMQCGVKVK